MSLCLSTRNVCDGAWTRTGTTGMEKCRRESTGEEDEQRDGALVEGGVRV